MKKLGNDLLEDGGSLLHPTRYEIIRRLKRSKDGMHINALAKAMKKDRRLISFHLITLAEHGFLEDRLEISKMPESKGKAVKVFTPSHKVDEVLGELKGGL